MQGDCARCLAALHRAGSLGVFVHGGAVAAGLVDCAFQLNLHALQGQGQGQGRQWHPVLPLGLTCPVSSNH